MSIRAIDTFFGKRKTKELTITISATIEASVDINEINARVLEAIDNKKLATAGVSVFHIKLQT